MDDTIYRRDAIDVARKCRAIEVTPAHMLIDKAEVMTELMMLPSAQPERKKGTWIEFPNLMAYKCSECGRIIQTTDGRINVSRHYPFCHCGADMRGDGNGTPAERR